MTLRANFNGFDGLFDLAMDDFRFTKSIIKDMHPYEIKSEENKVTIAYQAVGIDEKDISVSIKKENGISYLVIEGKTKNKELDKDFSIHGKFTVGKPEEIEKVQYRVENGMVYVYMLTKEYESKIEIEKL
jgi:HSP20 family molecular chaperone IbpA